MTTPRCVVIGVGNEYRRDDGVGPAVIRNLRELAPVGVELVVADGEPTQLLDAWSGIEVAIVVDAVQCDPSTPGRLHRTGLDGESTAMSSGSTHGLGIPDAVRLGEVLDRLPGRLVVLAVEGAEFGFGLGLTPQVEEALPRLTRAVLDEVERS